MKTIYAVAWDIASEDGDLWLSVWSTKELAEAEIDRLITEDAAIYSRSNLSITELTLDAETDGKELLIG